MYVQWDLVLPFLDHFLPAVDGLSDVSYISMMMTITALATIYDCDCNDTNGLCIRSLSYGNYCV